MKEAFKKIIKRLGERQEKLDTDMWARQCDNWYGERQNGVSDGIDIAFEIVNQVAEEYKHGHYGCNWNGQHERCKDCGLRGECSHYNTEWFGAKDMSDVPEINVGKIDEVCEWKLDGVYLHCQHKTDLIITCLEDEKYRYSFCPYCGKEIKVVE